MKPIIILESISDNGKVSISKEEFKEIINKAYDAGFQDGTTHGFTYKIPPQYDINFHGLKPPYETGDMPCKDIEINC